MTSPTPEKDSQIGKGYSYLFTLMLIMVILCQLINIQIKNNRAGEYEWAVATRELNTQVFYPCVALIAGILGLPTDTIALAFGKFITSEKRGLLRRETLRDGSSPSGAISQDKAD